MTIRYGRLRRSLAVLLLWLCTVALAYSDNQDERLVNVGLKLFPAVMAASEKLATLPDGETSRIYIVYRNNKPYARELAERLQQLGPLKGHRTLVLPLSARELRKGTHATPYALFIAQQLDEELAGVIHYARQNDVISFSPFRGDVEAGVLAGISISDRILPYINLQSLALQSHGLKPFFLKVAETYGP